MQGQRLGQGGSAVLEMPIFVCISCLCAASGSRSVGSLDCRGVENIMAWLHVKAYEAMATVPGCIRGRHRPSTYDEI